LHNGRISTSILESANLLDSSFWTIVLIWVGSFFLRLIVDKNDALASSFESLALRE